MIPDEAAFVIQLIVDDIWLWFDTNYGEQGRRYRPPDTDVTDDNLTLDFDDPF